LVGGWGGWERGVGRGESAKGRRWGNPYDWKGGKTLYKIWSSALKERLSEKERTKRSKNARRTKTS